MKGKEIRMEQKRFSCTTIILFEYRYWRSNVIVHLGLDCRRVVKLVAVPEFGSKLLSLIN